MLKGQSSLISTPEPKKEKPPPHHMEELRKLGQIGHIRGIQVKLDSLESEFPDCVILISEMRSFANDFKLSNFMTLLDAQEDDHGSK